jgi:hypothetical protein
VTLVTDNNSSGLDNVDRDGLHGFQRETKMKDIALSNPAARQTLKAAALAVVR